MTSPPISFATDEDILLRAPKDYLLICPRPQNLAAATDGVITAADRWTLRSLSGDFIARGVQPGHVLRLVGPPTALGSSGDLLVVASVQTTSLGLRRPGQPAGVGIPPGSPQGASGLEYVVPTLGPQIAAASSELARRFGINEHVPGRRLRDLASIEELREATTLTVIYQRLIDIGHGSGGQDDPLGAKASLFAALLDDLLARTFVRWNYRNTDHPSPLVTRLSR